jgi:ribosome production factor 1
LSEDDVSEEEESEEEDEDEEMPEAGPSTTKLSTEGDAPETEKGEGEEGEEEEEEAGEEEEQVPIAPPKIMITTSPSPCKLTYQFCDELKNVFPGGEFFKRPRGKGFELGRLARWGIKRGYGAVIVVNEDHKAPSKSHSPLGRRHHMLDSMT